MIFASNDGNATASRNFVIKSSITIIYLLSCVMTGNDPMEYAEAGSQGPNIGFYSSRSL